MTSKPVNNMISKKDLKARYEALPNKEKETVGSALVKVNLGVSMPMDQRRAAEFLKGSAYIAKSGGLDEVIQLLHDDEVDGAGDINSTQEILVSLEEDEESAKGLTRHPEDTVVTITDRHPDRSKK